jgi:hypothetical protein
LGQIGPGAAEALPLLEGIQEYAELRNVVREAIAKIKGTPPKKPEGGAKAAPAGGEGKAAPPKGEPKTATPAARG